MNIPGHKGIFMTERMAFQPNDFKHLQRKLDSGISISKRVAFYGVIVHK